MRIKINNEACELSEYELTIADLLTLRHIPLGGTAVAINNKLITREKWETTCVKDGDALTVISAAFGG